MADSLARDAESIDQLGDLEAAAPGFYSWVFCSKHVALDEPCSLPESQVPPLKVAPHGDAVRTPGIRPGKHEVVWLEEGSPQLLLDVMCSVRHTDFFLSSRDTHGHTDKQTHTRGSPHRWVPECQLPSVLPADAPPPLPPSLTPSGHTSSVSSWAPPAHPKRCLCSLWQNTELSSHQQPPRMTGAPAGQGRGLHLSVPGTQPRDRAAPRDVC